VAAGVFAIVGHSFSCFLGFKGGKGVATSVGVIIGLAPFLALIGLLVWAAVFGYSRMVSLASISAAGVVGLASWLPVISKGSLILSLAFTALGLLVIIRHRANIQRILAGTESTFKKKRHS